MDTDIDIPAPLRAEHHRLHERLGALVREPGAIGAAARELDQALEPHFRREEAFALPPLGLLPALARGERTDDMAAVLPLAQRLKAELPAMLAEHRQIVGALDKLRGAARAEGRDDVERFSEALAEHAMMEETVLYPAAILVGEVLERAA